MDTWKIPTNRLVRGGRQRRSQNADGGAMPKIPPCAFLPTMYSRAVPVLIPPARLRRERWRLGILNISSGGAVKRWQLEISQRDNESEALKDTTATEIARDFSGVCERGSRFGAAFRKLPQYSTGSVRHWQYQSRSAIKRSESGANHARAEAANRCHKTRQNGYLYELLYGEALTLSPQSLALLTK